MSKENKASAREIYAAKGNEFGASDLEGQTVLGEIDGPTPAMLKSVK